MKQGSIVAACLVLAMGAAGASTSIRGFAGKRVSAEHIDREATRMMASAKVQGLAMAVVDDGQVVFVRSWGHRNVEQKPKSRAEMVKSQMAITTPRQFPTLVAPF